MAKMTDIQSQLSEYKQLLAAHRCVKCKAAMMLEEKDYDAQHNRIVSYTYACDVCGKCEVIYAHDNVTVKQVVLLRDGE